MIEVKGSAAWNMCRVQNKKHENQLYFIYNKKVREIIG
ncbi:hypothetical protein GFC28_1394 [Anoxybacillus sp. B2M1]|jgi:hypothetical protein|nr:hypothetical protein GFC28_1394 [Anoxybacillus sp. B2M1]